MHNEITIFPSYYFLPRHYSGIEYKGHGWYMLIKNGGQLNKL